MARAGARAGTWAALPLAAAVLSPALARAQDVPDKVDQLIVYDRSDCPPDTPDTITSCIVITGESPYRIPSALRAKPDEREDESPAHRAVQLLRPVSGYGSCSAQGGGSPYGCAGLAYTDWKRDRGKGEAAYYAGLIAAERAKRLGLIEAEAEEQQAVVGEEPVSVEKPVSGEADTPQ